MTRTDCERIDPLLDLYAAGECDPADARAVRAHLDGCSRCREALHLARGLQGLLDVHFGEEDALHRLGKALHRESPRSRTVARHLPFVRRLTALAAMLLVCLGIGLWLEPG